MADAFAIVVDDVTAGIVVRHERDRRFRFYASERRFFPIDGQVFRSPRDAVRSAGRLLAGAGRLPPRGDGQIGSRATVRPPQT